VNNRRNILAGALALFRGTLLGQKKSSPAVASGPVAFGYKMAWLAVKSGKLADLVSYLNLKDSRSVPWDKGIALAYDDSAKLVFVTPPIHGWVLVVGWAAAAIADAEPVKSFYSTISKMSARFGEVQAFATHRIVDYHLWMMAKDGHVIRSLAYLGERGELLDNMGALTEAERKLAFSKEPPEQWNPNEEDVMTVAAGWSLDPTKLNGRSGPAELGEIGRVGIKIE
jgi:hypothetical protein